MKKVKLIILFLFMLPKIILAQDEYVVSQSKFLQKSNTSYFGFNQMGKVGVLYNTLEVNENNGSEEDSNNK